MLECGCSNAELAVGMFAELPALHVADLSQGVEAAERPDPVGTETEIVAATALDHAVGVGLAPQALVDAKRYVNLPTQVQHVLHRIDVHWRLHEIEIESCMPALQQSHSLGQGPGLIHVDPDQALGADAVAQSLKHGLLA